MIDYKAILKQFNQEIYAEFQAELALQMIPRKKGFEGFSNSKQLGIRDGGLYKSFKPVTKKITTTKAQQTIASDMIYAKIHEYGGVIKARKMAMFSKQKYVMESYFWYKYLTEEKDFYKILALTIKKEGQIKMPKRPYFRPALTSLESVLVEKAEEILIEMLNQIKLAQ